MRALLPPPCLVALLHGVQNETQPIFPSSAPCRSNPRTPLPTSPCLPNNIAGRPLTNRCLTPRPRPPAPRSAVPLSRSPLQSSADPRLAEAHLEAALRAAVEHHRRGLLGADGGTAWDEGLAHLLMPALDAYEHVGAARLLDWGIGAVMLVGCGDGKRASIEGREQGLVEVGGMLEICQ